MKRKFFVFITALMTISIPVLWLVSCEESTQAETNPIKTIMISTASPGGVYFPLGIGIAKVITDSVDGIFAMSQSTAGSVENIQLVGSGESEMGMAMANVAFEAYMGEDRFADSPQPIRALFTMYPSVQHLIASAASDIYTVDDLAGKKVSVDAEGSGTEVTSTIILEAAGVLENVITVNYAHQEAADSLIAGKVDAVFYNFAYPAEVVHQILREVDIRFVPLSDSLIDDIIADYPYFTQGVIPAGVYQLTEDVPTIMVDNLMLVHEDMSDNLAIDILNAIFNETAINELKGIHPVADFFQVELAGETVIPLHTGAEKFFNSMQ